MAEAAAAAARPAPAAVGPGGTACRVLRAPRRPTGRSPAASAAARGPRAAAVPAALEGAPARQPRAWAEAAVVAVATARPVSEIRWVVDGESSHGRQLRAAADRTAAVGARQL